MYSIEFRASPKRHMLGTLPAVPASDHFRKLLSDRYQLMHPLMFYST